MEMRQNYRISRSIFLSFLRQSYNEALPPNILANEYSIV